jgi:hypothetical protein
MRHDCDADGCNDEPDHRTPYTGTTPDARAYELVRQATVALDRATTTLLRDPLYDKVSGLSDEVSDLATRLRKRLDG